MKKHTNIKIAKHLQELVWSTKAQAGWIGGSKNRYLKNYQSIQPFEIKRTCEANGLGLIEN